MKRVLIIDDEKNIRLILTESIEAPGTQVDTAVSGEHGLEKFFAGTYDLVLLDIKMPGIDGMEVLRRIKKERPYQRVAMITAHGSIETAVEAMKLGAVDYLRKPFTPAEIRIMVNDMLTRERFVEGEVPKNYGEQIELAKELITQQRHDEARKALHAAIGQHPEQPEALNLLGVMTEMHNEVLEAIKLYRAALALDPTYQPAQSNLERVTRWEYTRKGMDLGDKNEGLQ